MESPATVRPAAALPAAAADAISRYHAPFRRALRRFAAEHPRQADLLASFPAACVALATQRGSLLGRFEAECAIRAGRPLRDIAEALDMPEWLRRFPPESFRRSIPVQLTFAEPIPGAYAMAVRRLPHNHDTSRIWIARLFDAVEKAPFDFALWTCSDRTPHRAVERECPALLAAHAFFSRNSQHEASKFIARPWSPTALWTQAAAGAGEWFNELLFGVALDLSHMPAEIVSPSKVGFCRITPLIDPRIIEAEGREMKHCIARYWMPVLFGRCILFRIESPVGERANFEVMLQPDLRPQIMQFASYANSVPPRSLAFCAYQWVETNFAKRKPDSLRLRLAVDPEVWDQLWTPYWDAHGPASGIPRRPDHDDLTRLIMELRQ